jgi:hypothetical protein
MTNIDEGKEEPKSYHNLEEERRKREEEEENALPWIERERWRQRQTYEGWETEEILERVGERAAIARSHSHYRVLITPDVGFIDVDHNLDYNIWHQQIETLANVREWVATHPDSHGECTPQQRV